jgi:methylenetetrahydrofolate dehydrogenase (NADP+)/methenyltetrahydrofolate cyclohydrolase
LPSIRIKDVDGFHPVNVGRLATGARDQHWCPARRRQRHPGQARPRQNLSGLNAVVSGRSNIVGKPVAQLLLQENCTVTIAHSRTRDLPEVCRRRRHPRGGRGPAGDDQGRLGQARAPASSTSASTGRGPATARAASSRRRFRVRRAVAGAITPVPGRVGPMTIALLMANTVTAAARARGRAGLADVLSRT